MQHVELVDVPLAADQRRRNLREAAAERLREHHVVGRDAERLAGEKRAGPAHAGLDLVGNQRGAARGAQRGGALGELRRDLANAAFALNRLEDHAGEAAGPRERLLEMRDVIDANAVNRQAVDQKRLAVVLIGGQLDGAERLAVKSLLERDEGPRSRFEDRVLHAGLDRLGARVAEDDAIVAARAARQLTRQLSGQRVPRALRVNRTAFGEQPLCFGHEHRVVMAEEQRPVPAHEIQHRHFLAVAVVIEIVALRPIEDHANAQQVEQPAELRLDHLVEVVRLDRLHVWAPWFHQAMHVTSTTPPDWSGLDAGRGNCHSRAVWPFGRDARTEAGC